MTVVALPVYVVGLEVLVVANNTLPPTEFSLAHGLRLYLYLLYYSFVFFNLWIAIGDGLSALYLRRTRVYSILQSLTKPKRHRLNAQ